MPASISPFTVASIIGIAFGLGLLVKGMAGQRRAARIGDTATSTISAIAVGEVRISGVVEPAEIVLTSPLQSRDCVYYRAKVSESAGRSERTILDEERAVGFRVRDASGHVRVFPRGAHWLVPSAFDASTSLMGDEPIGLRPRMGGAIQPGGLGRDAQIAALLTVHGRSDDPGSVEGLLDGHGGGLGLGGQREYEEARIEPGDLVTIVGMVQPFDQLPDPAGADAATGDGLDATGAIGDPEIASDLAEARAAGLLETDPAEAWGNAAIPGLRDRPAGPSSRARPGGEFASGGHRWTRPTATSRPSTSNPRRSSWPPRRTSACWCRWAPPARSSPARRPASWWACSGRSWPSSRPSRWPARSVAR